MRYNAKYLSNVKADCELKLLTQNVANFITSCVKGNYNIVALTWFDKFNFSNHTFDGDFIIALDVADPPYFLWDKVKWMKSLNKPVYLVGPVIKNFPFPIIPFFAWLRYRQQKYHAKQSKDNYFVSFNRKPHNHRLKYYEAIKKHPQLLDFGYCSFFEIEPKHEIASLELDKDIVKYLKMAMQIDEKQIYSSFEIVCESSATSDWGFLTEKFVKCIATETPLVLIGDYNILSILKNYYGFTDFGPDDSYDSEINFDMRVAKLLNISTNFFSYPLDKVYDNAKRNAEHLFTNFDSIHDQYVYKALSCIR